MLRVPSWLLALSLLACTTSEPVEERRQAASQPEPGLIGTFVAGRRSRGEFLLLTLEDDGTYHARKHVTCVAPPCLPIWEEGTYRTEKRGGDRYLGLLSQGRDLDVHRYRLRGDVLALQSTSPDAAWQSLTRRETAWCERERDCEGQALARGTCVGAYRCEQHACVWRCDEDAPDE